MHYFHAFFAIEKSAWKWHSFKSETLFIASVIVISIVSIYPQGGYQGTELNYYFYYVYSNTIIAYITASDAGRQMLAVIVRRPTTPTDKNRNYEKGNKLHSHI